MPRYLTVTALNRYLKFKMDSDSELQSILLKAEISNFKHHSSGHFYLTLKDDKSQVSAIMFSSNAKNVKFKPKDGDTVIIEGYVSVYEPYGTYQVYINKLQMDGVGDLYLAFERLKKELEAEGLFKEEHKLSLPKIPKTIGVVTSKTGAAIQDIINVINNRFPLTKIIIYPASVQGNLAKGEIVTQIKKANQDKLVDLLIVGRGGGSIEDLWPFNEEEVARAIYHSNIPIISAVGHETDMTISDYVADKRASTPSHGAELAVPNYRDIIERISNYKSRLNSSLLNKQNNLRTRYKNIIASNIFKNPLRIIQTEQLQFMNTYDRLIKNNPKELIQKKNEDINRYIKQLNSDYKHLLALKKGKFLALAEKLELVNPLAIMTKGYSIIKQEETIKKSIKEIDLTKPIDVLLHDGKLHCQILDMKGNKS
ncbi:MAG: exodeoxyribonuclease VII large subunit [Candidatus Izimaplasma sp.]|nr:exodeoxyribonuclease VII large subunit [Candidatus Izimaplasma bacterium]